MPVLGTLQAECGVATPVADIGAAVFFCANSHFYNVLRYCILSAAVSDPARGLGGACNASGRDAFRPITTVKFRTRTRMDSKEKKKKMTKTHKAVLSTLAVLCLLFMGSGVAQAQECFAFPKRSEHGSRRGHDRGGGKHPIAVQGPNRLWPAAPSRGSRNQHYAEHPDHQCNGRPMVIRSWASPTLMVRLR